MFSYKVPSHRCLIKRTPLWVNGVWSCVYKEKYSTGQPCLVPRPHYSAWPKRFGSCGPSENVRPRPKKWDKSEIAYAVVYKTSVSHFKVKNTPLKDTDGKEKLQRMLSFLLVDKGRLFFPTLSFKEFEIHEFSSQPIGALGLFWNATKQPSFWRIFRYILSTILRF